MMTIPKLIARAGKGERLTMVTAYDHPSAVLADEAGIDILLVGDSLGNVVQGEATTLPVTLEQSLYHTRLVARGVTKHSLVVGDMPFGTYQASEAQAIENAARYLKEAGAQAVKLEGGARVEATIAAMVRAQIPVMAHIGLTPQSVHVMGGYKIQRVEAFLLDEAERVQAAGAFSVVLEGVQRDIATTITERLEIPTIGIGAGPDCDGQVLVWHDLLGLTDSAPKFVKRYATLAQTIRDALKAYKTDVEAGTFPGDEHSYAGGHK